ncbi:hypothetical protein BC830DRAFT_267576 [Chytriomyces sp. MP71]|nr:hypothetical protein BC830DRAFT_267576 [Chytriomyces sp. MP71]
MQYANLVHFIQYMAISAPDAFLSVETWGKSVDVRGDVFRGGGDGSPSAFLLKSISDAKRICLLRELRELERSIERRIRDVQYQVRKSPETPVAANVLNLKDCEEICIPTLAKRWFGLTGTSTSPPPISKPIKELIRWALLPAVGGNLEFRRRVYLVSSLLMEVVRFANFGSGRARVQVVLMEYLTDFVMKGDVMDVDIDYKNIIWLFGDFIRSHLFSVANFLQRLISRGCFEDSQHKDRYLKLIVDLPVLDTGNHISNTRLELRKENDDMEAHEAERQETSEMMDLLRKIAPALFNASMSAADTFESRTVSRDEAGRLWKLFLDQSSRANSFVHSQVAKWIKHEYENYVVKSVAINAENWKKHISSLSAGSSLLSVEQYLMVVFVYENFEDLRGILELNLWLLVNRFDKKLNACIIETFRKYTYCFRYMNELGNIANTLWINRQSFVVHSSAGVNILENTFVSYLNTIYTWLSAEHREKWATFVTESQVPKVNKEPVTQDLSFRFGNSSDASRRILVYSILVMYKFAAANNATLTQKRVNMTVRVLQGYNDHGSFLDTHFGEILAGFLGDAPSPTTLPISASVSESWFANFAVQLILSQCCRVQTVVDKFLAPVVSQQFGQSKLEQRTVWTR